MLRSVDMLNAGCPVVFLDLRERKPCNDSTRQGIIDKAKKQYVEMADQMMAKGARDRLNCCAIAWFHFQCVGLSANPKGKWLCPTCRRRDGSKR